MCGMKIKNLPPEQREEKKARFAEMRQQFQSFLRLPLARQRKIRRKAFGICG
jgi:hypothetical protein